MEALQLGDIISVVASETGGSRGFLLVTVKQRVTKGSRSSQHQVTYEGHPTEVHGISADPVYWLNKHLKKSFELDLRDFSHWNLSVEVKRQSLFSGWKKASMSAAFRERSVQAGYKDSPFSFHSLRSGFICSALVKAGSDVERIRGVLEMTGFAGEWAPGSRAQLGYVKLNAKRTIVASRLIAPQGNTELPPNPVAHEMTDTEAFHGIKRRQPSFPKESNFCEFRSVVKGYHRSLVEGRATPGPIATSLWNRGFTRFVKERPELERKAHAYLRKRVEENVTTKIQAARRVVARKFITKTLDEDYSRLPVFIEEMKGYADEEMERGDVLQLVRRAQTREEEVKVTKSTRVRWTEEEDRKLRKGVKDELGWKMISLLKFNKQRSACDCKDRWKNIMKSEKKKKGASREDKSAGSGRTGGRGMKRGRENDDVAELNLRPRKKARIKWTEEEDAQLEQGVREGKKWHEIAPQITSGRRTNRDCRDRWVNILKKRARDGDDE